MFPGKTLLRYLPPPPPRRSPGSRSPRRPPRLPRLHLPPPAEAANDATGPHSDVAPPPPTDATRPHAHLPPPPPAPMGNAQSSPTPGSPAGAKGRAAWWADGDCMPRRRACRKSKAH
eukprot:TRINITY_DN3399_c0_g1_i1.p2 TRINITY_DN3399_c0_g1~~TRINITY_DN3399_c0_g1_i1.p2  ORF type:complete len:117 (-),score=0.81 TRINITY_DN3399_c0_g1_i1:591-941(-)